MLALARGFLDTLTASPALEEPSFPGSSLTPSSTPASLPFSALFGWPDSLLRLEMLVWGHVGTASCILKELPVSVFQGILVNHTERVSCAMPAGRKIGGGQIVC